MGTTLIDGELLRRRRAELGLSLREVASAAGLTGPTYVAIENGLSGTDPGLDPAVRLARALGLSLDALVSDDVEATEDDDAATLGALVAISETLTPVGALVELLGWPLERLHAAEVELSARLAGVGLALRRSTARLAFTRAHGVIDDAMATAAVRKHLARDRVNLTEARMLRHIMYDNVPTQPSNSDQKGIGVLVNADLVSFSPANGKREATMVLSADVRDALMLDEDPSPVGDRTPRRRRSPVTAVGSAGRPQRTASRTR